MDNLTNYLNSRLKFLYEVLEADHSEDSISVMGQIHEIKNTILWIEENSTPNTTEPQTSHAQDTPKDRRTYKDGVKDAYNDVLKMIYADGSDADDIKNALEDALCNN